MTSNQDPLSPQHRSPSGKKSNLDSVYGELQGYDSIDDLVGRDRLNVVDVINGVGEYYKTVTADPLSLPKFCVFVGIALICATGGVYIALDPFNKHTEDHQEAGMAAAVAALTGVGGLFAR